MHAHVQPPVVSSWWTPPNTPLFCIVKVANAGEGGEALIMRHLVCKLYKVLDLGLPQWLITAKNIMQVSILLGNSGVFARDFLHPVLDLNDVMSAYPSFKHAALTKIP